jgi:hypothetical protein
MGEETHGAGKTVAAEPAQSFLSAVGEKYNAEEQAKNGHGEIICSVHELAKHGRALLFKV